MNRVFVGVGVALVLACTASGLSAQDKAKFDAADVQSRSRNSNANPQLSGGVLRSGRYDLRNATMVDLIGLAYGVDASAILGGPNWLELNRFDVTAKAAQSTPPDTVKLMLQSLLADRFKLALHNDTKSQPAFALTVGTGKHKLKEAADASAPPTCDPVPSPPPAPGVTPINVVSCHNMTMELFAQFIRNVAAAYVPARVVDATALKGGWDFDLKWTQRALLAQAGADGISIFDAVDKQLGLKLESRTLPTPVIIVDSVEEKPTPNAADIATVLPPKPPAEFEVATIKPADPTGTMIMARIQPGGRVDIQGMSLMNLLTLAWEINDNELLVGPKWMDEVKFNVTARVATDAIGASRGAEDIALDIEDVQVMLQALLTDRFKLKMHTEERPVTTWVLTAPGPKLTSADPINRTTWKNGIPAAGARDPRDNNPIVSRLVTCQNMSMAQLAALLPRMAPGYIRTPVIDATNLRGSFDFSFSFTPNGVGGVGGGGRGDGGQPLAAAGASDPTGAISLPDALSKQLGLRLESQKRPYPVMVIDHAEEKPTDD